MSDDFWHNTRMFASKNITPKNDKRSEFMDLDTAEVYEGYVGDHTTKDSARFVKLFFESIGVMSALPTSGIRVLFVVMWSIRNSQDSSIIELSLNTLEDYLDYMSDIEDGFNISRSTFFRGIAILEERGLIRKIRINEYQINPSYLFNGDRVKAANKEINKRK